MGTRRHSEHEERRARVELGEQRQDRVGLASERRAGFTPVRRADPPAHELMPVLVVDAEKKGGAG